MASIGMQRKVAKSFDEVLARLPEALKSEGFGVLTQIDVQETLKQKLGVEFKRYRIFGACNPNYAYRALLTEASIGALLPCSIAAWEEESGKTVVNAVDPLQTIAATMPAFAPIAIEVREKLARALEAI
jgi:uncharacterized protein (DUF302 family)